MAAATLGSAIGSGVDSAAKHTMACRVDVRYVKGQFRGQRKLPKPRQEQVFNAKGRDRHEHLEEISRSLRSYSVPTRDHNSRRPEYLPKAATQRGNLAIGERPCSPRAATPPLGPWPHLSHQLPCVALLNLLTTPRLRTSKVKLHSSRWRNLSLSP